MLTVIELNSEEITQEIESMTTLEGQQAMIDYLLSCPENRGFLKPWMKGQNHWVNAVAFKSRSLLLGLLLSVDRVTLAPEIFD